jgi:xylan 1,4-beta-xylosidase
MPLPNEGKVRMKMEVRGYALQFYYALWQKEWQKIGPVLDASTLSDEAGPQGEHGNFTGTFVGMACSDLNGTALHADFTDFVYRPVKHTSDRY